MRYCRNCGMEVKKEDKNCPYCGWDFKSKIDTPIDNNARATSNAIVFSVLSIIFSFFPGIGIFIGLIGLIIGYKNYERKSVITAIVGMSICFVATIIWIIYLSQGK